MSTTQTNPAAIPDSHRDLLDKPVFASLATVSANGMPQNSVVWFSYDGTHVNINTARGRLKDRNMMARPRVAILLMDPANPYRTLEIRGVVDEVDESAGLAHINFLSKRYRGVEDYYSSRPEMRGKEQRVVFRIRPTRVLAR